MKCYALLGLGGLLLSASLQAAPRLKLPNSTMPPPPPAPANGATANDVPPPASQEEVMDSTLSQLHSASGSSAPAPRRDNWDGSNGANSKRPLAQAPAATPAGVPAPADPNALPPPKLPKKMNYTDAESKAECRKFEGKFIAYYDRVFKVEGCKRREVVSDDDEENPILRGHRVIPVENLTVAKIPEGPAIGSSPKGKKPNCAKIEGRYIISRASDVFYVEGCKKRPFPDWDTYADHSSKHLKKGQEILELPEEEFLALPLGAEFKSSLNDEYKKMLVTEKNVDILPIDEACKGLNGSYVSYYSKIYKVDACRKHEVDAERFMMRFPSYKLREMTSEQWVSLPTGKPVKL